MFASDAAAMVDTIRDVLQLLMNARLKCKPSKCALFTERVHNLEFIATARGIEPDPIKTDRIQQWQRPDRNPGAFIILGTVQLLSESVAVICRRKCTAV